jgi:hypothetical protein
MKTKLLILGFAVLLFSSCKKDDNGNTPPTETNAYINTNAGSSWTYHETNSSGITPLNTDYTLVSSSADTSINGKTYHIFNYSYGGSQYLNISGHEYFQFDSIPGGLNQVFDRLYLKDNVAAGTTWKQDLSVTVPDVPLPVPVTITNTISEKGISRDVNGTTYSNVIHVSTSITSSLIPASALTSSIDSYYAEKYGLIENSSVVSLNFFGITKFVDVKTKLTSATLK